MRVVAAALILFCFLPLTTCITDDLGKLDAADIDNEEIDFGELSKKLELHLVSWPRLKRQAGYFSEAHVYKGGLYKEAMDEEFEFYQCLSENKQHCTSWTAHEESKDEVEYGKCKCVEFEDSYCTSWKCFQLELAFDANCGDLGCQDELQIEKTKCKCHTPSPNGNYCRSWNCTETGSDGNLEEEVYACLEEDKSGKYCYLWSGNVTSETEIESSACQCVERGTQFCVYWICKERGIERCEAHTGWCNRRVALGIGGGLGAAFTVVGVGIAPPNANRQERAFLLAFVFFFGCLPWIAGVLIWGGLYVLPWVAMIWISTFVMSLCWIWWDTRERRPLL